MPKRVIVIMIVVVAVIIAVALLVGLGPDPIDIDEVRAYADLMTEDILVAMNEGDYEQFSEGFSADMKEAMPQAVFDDVIRGRIQGAVGEYMSKGFLRAERHDAGVLVSYEADFTEEPDAVIVRVFFREIEVDMYVSGLWFDSPKLRELG